MKRNSLPYVFILSIVSLVLSAQESNDAFVYPEVKIVNETAINSPVMEFSPAFFEDGLLFVSTKSSGKKYTGYDKKLKKPTMSIFLSRRDDQTGSLKQPEPFALELTTKLHEGPLTFDRTAEKVYFTRNDLKKKKRRKSTKLKIYESVKEKGKWSLPIELPFNLDEYETAHPTISVDGKKIIFASNRPGGYGGMDLYMSTLAGNIWSEPINLGSYINTPKNELFPFIHADNMLYFASDGHQGLGGLDLFYTFPQDDSTYSIPANMGPPFCSRQDDLGFILDRDKKNGYFSSNRTGGNGEDDIYAFSISDGQLDELLFFQKRVPDVLDEVSMLFENPTGHEPIPDVEVNFLALNSPAIDSTMLDRDQYKALAIRSFADAHVASKELDSAFDSKGRIATSDSTGQVQVKLKKGYYAAQIKHNGTTIRTLVVSPGDDLITVPLLSAIGCIPLKGIVVNNQNESHVPNALVKIMDHKGQFIAESVTDNEGVFQACIKCGADYTLKAFVDNHEIGQNELKTTAISCEGVNMFDFAIPVSEPEVVLTEGTIIELNNIYFNFNDVSLRPDSKKDVEKLVEVLNSYPNMEVEIAAYTDARGKEDFNLQLSQKRADKVFDELVSLGIDEARLMPIGYGESGIRNECLNGVRCSDKKHQFNRRIEIKIIKTDKPVIISYNDHFPGVMPDSNAPTEPKPTDTPTTEAPIAADEASEYRSFKIIVGAFLMDKNALKMADKMRHLGYDDIEILNFGDSPAYSSVSVKTFYSFAEALEFANSLKSEHGLDFYIKKLR